MPNPKGVIAALAAGFLACARVCRGADAPAPVVEAAPIEQVAAKLPPDLGEAARKWLHEDPKDLKALTGFTPGALEQEVMIDLAS